MVNRVQVFYEGWNERWHWGTLATSTNSRAPILFEYSSRALEEKLELSALHLPVAPTTYSSFPPFQERLPGIIADSLPDGWGRLLMDRLFRKLGRNPEKINVLERLSYISDTAMGALTYHPEASYDFDSSLEIPLEQLARESQAILEGEDSELLPQLVEIGGSPQGARPKALIYRCKTTKKTSTVPFRNAEPWLIKFPARSEHPEVCAIEYVYAACAFQCGLDVPEVDYFDLNTDLAAFGSKRFDRFGTTRIPMHSLAGYLESDFRIPSCDYDTLIRATGHITQNNLAEVHKAYTRTVFNVIFNNRDDHTKNIAFLLNQQRQWQLSPAYDLTFNEGPNGYHQMSVMGEAWLIPQRALLQLAKVAHLTEAQAKQIIDLHCHVANQFSSLAKTLFQDKITPKTLISIQKKLHENIKAAQG